MKSLAWFALAIALAGYSCAAQDLPATPTVISGMHTMDIPRNAPSMPGYLSETAPSPSPYVTTTSAGAFTPPASPRAPRVASSNFFLVNIGFLGMAVADVELTQRCIASHHCIEKNPLMPSSQAGQLTFDLGLVAGVSGISYWLKKHNSPLWWLAPTTGIGVHTVGVATGIKHQ
jgi:hypothetical protein